ncbi:hypothetical protein FPHYL_1445 [Fusarium phyllophilum]|uniref:Uncharacterized protein n=1 Tax=Fusarium phyllophilum TaxID=47803 RepID=A0A8H5KB80_9HYPO|nr:hypothetical protein FPHYL_1445 [Fusarium phyllophilum]
MMRDNTAVSYIWVPIAGWISASTAILMKQNDSTDTDKTAYALIGAVSLLSMQNEIMCAIRSNMGQAAALMAAADGSVGTSLIANQQAIEEGIIKAMKEFQDTLSAVQSLVAIDSNIQTTGITADINAPSVYSENP